MSKEHKLNWFAVVVYLVLVSMIVLLVALNWTTESDNGATEQGLQCVYNCDNYNEIIKGLK